MFCHLYKWLIEKEIDDYGRIKNSGILRHIQKCSTCQSWSRSLIQLEEQLKTTSQNISDSHMQQIQDAVHNHLSDAAKGHIPTKTCKIHPIRYVVSAAALIVIAIGLFSLYSINSYKRKKKEMQKSIQQYSKQLQEITALAGFPEKVIEDEIQNTQASARYAIGFVQNCLPLEFVDDGQQSKTVD
jgi:undecaprenyl pyrophosphate synthase